MPRSLISATAWPVFEDYEFVKGPSEMLGGYIAPAQGAAIRERVDLMDPATRQEALEAAISLVRWKKPSARSLALSTKKPSAQRIEHIAKLFGAGTVDRPALLDYARRFGLFGFGPSRLIDAVHRIEHLDVGARVYRRAGRLDGFPMPAVLAAPSFVRLEGDWSDFKEPTWEYCAGCNLTSGDVFRYAVGGDEWWALYAEPLRETVQAVAGLTMGADGLEEYLRDTFVDLSAARGSLGIDRSQIGWRSISAIGALALGVLEGGLDGWHICEYELCRQPFELTRKGQRFCKPWHQRRQWEREHAKREGGGEDGR